jgi:malate dehydrogenase (oxaloacetate-decarboxylating)
MMDLKEISDERTGERALAVSLRGRLLLGCSLLNKGSAFPDQERRDFDLLGLLPARVSTLEDQVARRYEEYRQKGTDLERFLFLSALQDRNETLFFRLVQDHLAEMVPMIYTPEVGEACQRYSDIFHRPRGLFLSYPQRQDLDAALTNRPFREVDVLVVTDGERILGLGDLGVGGIGIPVGKLALYTLCGGIHPARTLPVVLDVGTNNPEKLADPHYLGWRHERVRGPDYDAFIEAFVQAVVRHLPGVLLQWEDFAQANARRLLDLYRDRVCTFNDDIQGTGAVTLAALLSAVRVNGARLRDQRLVLLGAGSASTGISDVVRAALVRDGLTDEEARSRLWLVSSRGLVHESLPGLWPWQQRYAQPTQRVAGWRRDPAGKIPLAEVVERVRPTALIGVCGQHGAFTEEVVRAMAVHVERPILFPLSNPTSRSEAVPADLVAWTEGRALIATGSPFPDVSVAGHTMSVAQCNNVYVFPGLGLGAIASGARRITDEMVLAAAHALSACAAAGGGSPAALLPPLDQVCVVARQVALAVGAEAQRQGFAPQVGPREWERLVADACWKPRYQPMRYHP